MSIVFGEHLYQVKIFVHTNSNVHLAIKDHTKQDGVLLITDQIINA